MPSLLDVFTKPFVVRFANLAIVGVVIVGEVASTMLPEPWVLLPRAVIVPDTSGAVRVLVVPVVMPDSSN